MTGNRDERFPISTTNLFRGKSTGRATAIKTSMWGERSAFYTQNDVRQLVTHLLRLAANTSQVDRILESPEG